jgi:adenine-specific DNA-methyltransferase
VTLSDFGVFYGQDDDPALLDKLKPGGSRVSVVNGQVVRLTKDKLGQVTEERLTKTWTDWIDYWAIDFEFESKPEIVRIVDSDGAEREIRTGNYIFENEWQSFRTRKDRKLEMTSAPHSYSAPGSYKIAVKVIDIFGNDTTKVIPVEVV